MFGKILKSIQAGELTKGKIISFINQKGGVGKTTLLFNTAFGLKEKGHKVLCLDMDPQGNLTQLMGASLSENGCWLQLLNSVKELGALHRPVSMSEALVESMDMWLLPSHQNLSGFDMTVAPIMAPRQLILKNMIKLHHLRRDYDFILIDAPPTLGLLMVNIVAASDGIIIPFQPDRFSQQGLSHFHQMIQDVVDMQVGASPRIIGHIPNKVDERRKTTQLALGEIGQDLLGTHVFQPIPDKAAITQATMECKSVYSYHTKAYRELQTHFDAIASKIQESFKESHHG